MDDEERFPATLRRGRRETSLASISRRHTENAARSREFAKKMRKTAAIIKGLGSDRKSLMRYIAGKPEYMDELRLAWAEALYGPGSMTKWFAETIRPENLKGIAGGGAAGVPVDTGQLQESLTTENADGSISSVVISRDGRLMFRYGAAPPRLESPIGADDDEEPDENSSYLDEINEFYGGFYEVGLDMMSQSPALAQCWAKVSSIMREASIRYVKEKIAST